MSDELGPKVELPVDEDWRNRMQIEVARPRGGYDDQPREECFTGAWVMESKFDGIRKTAQFGESKCWLVSRNRHGKTKGVEHSRALGFVGSSELVPWLTTGLRGRHAGTMLDGELAVDEQAHKVVGATMVGHLEVADPDKLKYVAFDVLFFRGRDVRQHPWQKRRAILEQVIKEMGSPKVEASKLYMADKILAQAWFEAGAEGAILKPRDTAYLPGRASRWWKYKAAKTVDVFVNGVSEATSGGSPKNGVKPKPNGKASRFKVGLMRDGKPVDVGWCGDLPPEAIERGLQHLPEFYGRVIEMKTSGWDGRWFGWGRFKDWRADKTPGDCDWESQVGGLKVQAAEESA